MIHLSWWLTQISLCGGLHWILSVLLMMTLQLHIGPCNNLIHTHKHTLSDTHKHTDSDTHVAGQHESVTESHAKIVREAPLCETFSDPRQRKRARHSTHIRCVWPEEQINCGRETIIQYGNIINCISRTQRHKIHTYFTVQIKTLLSVYEQHEFVLVRTETTSSKPNRSG